MLGSNIHCNKLFLNKIFSLNILDILNTMISPSDEAANAVRKNCSQPHPPTHTLPPTNPTVKVYLDDRLGAGIIHSFRQRCPRWAKVAWDTLISQWGSRGTVCEDLPLEKKLMVMDESWVRAPATSSISGLHNEYPPIQLNLTLPNLT